MNLPFPFKWPWPCACTIPKTMSFRATHDIFKKDNSAYLDASNSNEFVKEGSEEEEDDDSIETMIRGLRSDRLFFEPENKSIVKESGLPITESLAIMTVVDSTDPLADFKKSMEEMVEAHGLKDWECLQDLLTCYLNVNCESNHGYIVEAFVDFVEIYRLKLMSHGHS